MYKLFIVDDEQHTRLGLRDYFNWKKYGIEVVGEAEDGDIALEMISGFKPDIIITDVRMPIMDGITMSLKIRERFENIKIIFLSGYDDVEYLKSALKVDAIDYIFKPVNFNELGMVVEKVINIIGVEEKQKHLMYEMDSKIKEGLPLVRDNFFLSLIRDRIDETKDINEKINLLGIDWLKKGTFIIFSLIIDNCYELFKNMHEKDKQLHSFAIINICEELLHGYGKGAIFQNEDYEYVGIVSLKSYAEFERAYDLVNIIKEQINKLLKLSVTIGMGNIVNSPKEIYKSYKQSTQALEMRFFIGKNKIIDIESDNNNNKIVYKFDSIETDKLISVLKFGHEANVLSTIDNIFDDMYKSIHQGIRHCQRICFQLILIPSRSLMELEMNINEIEYSENDLYEKIFNTETIEDMKALIIDYYKFVNKIIEYKRNKKHSSVVEQIKNIINENFSKNITVNDIANEVYLTSTYICTVFKQEVGETINDYITKIRINKAKELLKDRKHKLYNISYAVGYSDPSYFTKLFKKHTGLSPRNYRENVM